jgi:hypothetical protein
LNRAVAMAAVAIDDLAEDFYEEVANYEGTIEEAAEKRLFPPPALMEFNSWQKWRKAMGMRPTKRLGSKRPTTTGQEAVLWRRVMEQYYGEDWQLVLAVNQSLDLEADEEELDLTDPQLSVARPSGPAPTSSEIPVAAPSGAAPRPLGAGVGLGIYDLTEGVEVDDRQSSDRTSSAQSGAGDA